METKLKFLTLLFLLMALSVCGGACFNRAENRAPSQTAETLRLLDELAEVERAGTWIQGMALAESGIRERTGDYAGAVAAAYKEMAMAYGKGLIQKDELEKGLLNVLTEAKEEAVITATNSILAFVREQWDAAHSGLAALFDELDEPDSIGRWMMLVCALEKNKAVSAEEDRKTSAAYRAIRARYAQFPEYWYRGARAFSGLVAADYAERCINSSSRGVFAGECRSILASAAGLKSEDGPRIKTKTEIESIITQSIAAENPEILDDLLPLISLPDNAYTIYAVGALGALVSSPKYRDYFNERAAAAKGRLAERLSFICRG